MEPKAGSMRQAALPCFWNACTGGLEPTGLHSHTPVQAHTHAHTFTSRQSPELTALLRAHLVHWVVAYVPTGGRILQGRVL